MAEIRKFTPGRGGDIAQALAKAMGEPVRPIAPGDGGTPAPRKARPATTTGPRASSAAIWDPFLRTTPARPARPAEAAPAADEVPAADDTEKS